MCSIRVTLDISFRVQAQLTPPSPALPISQHTTDDRITQAYIYIYMIVCIFQQGPHRVHTLCSAYSGLATQWRPQKLYRYTYKCDEENPFFCTPSRNAMSL